ncbi:unnamed protein product [Amoebophrya sp. A25]|nr:unnamed protein product [Amoebophrya sp. A25]|eukprot:GSA25T00011486001.1
MRAGLLKYVAFSGRCTGHALASCVLLGGGVVSECVRLTSEFTARILSLLFGARIEQLRTQAPCSILPRIQGVHAGMLRYRPGSEGALGAGLPQVLDEEATLEQTRPATLLNAGEQGAVSTSKSKIPVETDLDPLLQKGGAASSLVSGGGDARQSSANLIALAHNILRAEFGTMQPDLLAEDFRFVFPVVGPLSKREFVEAFSSFQVRNTFPQLRGNFFGFQVDPLEPDRVWFFSRGDMLQTGPLKLPGLGCTLVKANSSKRVLTPPQILSMSFHADGRCYQLTGGYVADRMAGTCDGLGGFFGVLHALGITLPFPEGRPWKPSPFWEVFIMRAQQIIREWRQL